MLSRRKRCSGFEEQNKGLIRFALRLTRGVATAASRFFQVAVIIDPHMVLSYAKRKKST